ncbi:unnamed protein product [Soboliphyme baturini]|uniref:Uncharacterized protein n=1 Tax=Soboliphyme baturini TaxID=241478 RepID=A0A183IHY5_9BILA|nr:unnamed protein product [Soboliphyme baturini]
MVDDDDVENGAALNSLNVSDHGKLQNRYLCEKEAVSTLKTQILSYEHLLRNLEKTLLLYSS